MIKTLRITIIAISLLAAAFFVLSAVCGKIGLRHDKDKEAFLAVPSATDVFKKAATTKSGVEQDVPLIKQAQALALRLNPPKPKEVASTAPPVPVIETPKFTLLGTSFYPDDPNRSMALIDEPGKGMHWVVQNDKVGHLTITQIADGKVVYTDGQKSAEILAEKPQKVAQIIVIPVREVVVAPTPTPEPVTPAAVPELAAVPVTAAEETSPPVETPPTPDEFKDNAEFIKKLIAFIVISIAFLVTLLPYLFLNRILVHHIDDTYLVFFAGIIFSIY
ncbi:MAG: hypothetical protein Q7T18_11530, partial [Sedimentisphaerales bacterium]|nr:hypothetical protein [Sedimentisphaerales bacterium]